MNIKFEKDISISSLLPADHFSSRPLPFDDDLQAMLDEIGLENEDAFREVLRMAPLPGRKKPKLAYARNFFGSLEDMARYFDSSKDQYYAVPLNGGSQTKESGTDPKPTDTDNDTEMEDATTKPFEHNKPGTKEVYKGYRISSAESLSPGTRIAMLKNLLKVAMHKFQCRDHEPIPHPREKLVVRGVKIQSIQYHCCIARMPQEVKMARARFVEGPVMAIATRDELRFKEKSGLETPDKTGFVGERFDLLREIGWMLILASQRAREGQEKPANGLDKWWTTKQRWGGGPTKWGQLASEIFEDEDPSWSPEEKKLQEDKRKQQEEERTKGIDVKAADPKKLDVEDLIANGSPDTTKAPALPGLQTGGPPTALRSDLDIRPKRKKMRSMDRPPGDEVVLKDGRRLMYVPPFKKKWYQDWQKLRPNAPTIDEKIISKKIGIDTKTGFDEVFMVTSVNHHVALVKMKVHPDYLAWLETGRFVPNDETSDMKRNVLYVSRSTWFDMFSVEARKEFLVALWRTFCWINRDHIPQAEYERIRQQSQHN